MKFFFEVDEIHVGERLNIFLRSSGVSAALIKKIKFYPDGILVNGIKQNTNYSVKYGDKIEINTSDEEIESTVIPQDGSLNIVYEDECCMVIDKPYGMPCHPSFNHPIDTVANYFMGYWRKKGKNKICRVINRLDKNTSGLVLIALDPHTAEKLKGGVSKTYIAIAEGKFEKEHGIIDAPIAREKESIITRCVRDDGQKAVTEYWVEKQNEDFSIVKVKLHTGRTHQIRVHFSYIGHPLAGDDLYGGKRTFITRHALHCAELEFVSPSKNTIIKVVSKLPEDMNYIATKIY